MKAIANAALCGFALLTVGALSGCAPIYHTEVGNSFSGEQLAAQSDQGGVPLQVDGAVAGIRGAPLGTAVAAAMPDNLKYQVCAPFTECSGDHIVWTFGPPPARPASVYPAAFHVDPNIFGDDPAPSVVNITVAVFQGGNVVATAEGQVNAPGGADDPAFKALIHDLSDTVLAPGWFD